MSGLAPTRSLGRPGTRVGSAAQAPLKPAVPTPWSGGDDWMQIEELVVSFQVVVGAQDDVVKNRNGPVPIEVCVRVPVRVSR